MKKFAVFCVFLIGCASAPKKPTFPTPAVKVFQSDYSSVFAAAKKALSPYSFNIVSFSNKVLETDIYEIHEKWQPQHRKATTKEKNGYYLINVKFLELEEKTAVKVTKKQRKQLDFISSKDIPSDGLEENMILYRIKRELFLDKILKKLAKKKEKD